MVVRVEQCAKFKAIPSIMHETPQIDPFHQFKIGQEWRFDRVPGSLNHYSAPHYSNVIMRAMASQITGVWSVYSTVCSGADQRKHQSSASLAFVRGNHRWSVNSPQQMASNAEHIFTLWRHRRPTSEFLDTIYSYNVYPLITKPTRVTSSSATLIDHILSNNIDISSGHMQGILCTSMSDHFAIFHIAGNVSTGKLTQPVSPKLTRDMRRKKGNTFLDEMHNIDWNNLLLINDAQCAYTAHSIKFYLMFTINVFRIKNMISHIIIKNFGWHLH